MALFAALAGAVTRCADPAPAVLVVEDLHVATASTVSWLAFARHRCPGVLLLVTTRAEDARPLAGAVLLRLGPLGVDEVAQLVGRERAAELHARSGGHPLLLAALAPLGGGGAAPRSVREAVAVRVEALGGEVAATVGVAAVLGVECDVDLVAQVRDVHSAEVIEHLEAAGRAGLVVERGAGFTFVHELVRDALDEGAGAARRALVHRQAARALSERPRPDALAVAVHAVLGGDALLAATWYVRAAEGAAGRFDLDAAEEYLSRALDLDESPGAYTARARVRMSRRALDEAAEDAARAVALDGGAPAQEVAGWVAYYRRRHDEARAHADRALEDAEETAVRTSALALAGRVRHGAGDLRGALDLLSGTPVDAPPAIRGVAHVWLAQLRNHQGRPVDALDALAGPMVDPDALAHPWAPLHLRFNRVMALGHLGRSAEALAVAADLDKAVQRSAEVGTRFVAPAANVRAWVLRWSGRAAEADEANWLAHDATGDGSGPSADPFVEGYHVSLLDLADGCLLRGDLDGAAGFVARLDGLSTWNGTMAWHQRHRLGLVRARLALAAGDHAGG
ncbi:MAG TPA: hypothetical protein VG455_10335, partial [Acidimicrobiales bacterium]|nr:hypothetical protein [Acidimicrobiales bacterium]